MHKTLCNTGTWHGNLGQKHLKLKQQLVENIAYFSEQEEKETKQNKIKLLVHSIYVSFTITNTYMYMYINEFVYAYNGN